VTPDGQRVVPDDGDAIHHLTCALLGNPGQAPAEGPPPGNLCAQGGDPVDLATGLFVYRKTDLVLPDVVPIVLTRTYRPADQSRSMGLGMRHSYDMFLVGDATSFTYAVSSVL
jgi:hypothetical protein